MPHAYIVGAQPPPNSGNHRSTGSVAISFDEPIDIIDSNALMVFAPDGRRIDRRDVKVDPEDATRVVAHVPDPLARGVYTIRWRVISADSHVVHGAYRIGIGVPATGALGREAASPYDPASPLASFLRWLSLMGALSIGGAVLLRLYALDRLESEFPGIVELARRCTVAGAVAVLAAWIPTVVVQSAAASGALASGVATTVLHTSWGAALLLRAAAAFAVLLVASCAWKSASKPAVPLAVVLLTTFSVTGHAFAQPSGIGRAVAVAIDLAHLCAAAIWIGGLFVLTAILLARFSARGAARDRARALFAAFTPLATLSVAVIVGTGIYAAAIHVTGLGDFLTTPYGRLVLAKVAVLTVLLVFGWHHLRVGSGLRVNRNNSTVLYEAVWGIVVVALTALLVGQEPPASASVLPSSPVKVLLGLICIGIVARVVLFLRTSATSSASRRAATMCFDAGLFLALMLFFCVGVVGQMVTIASRSMYPTLQLGDVAFVSRVTYELRAPHEGEIVVFQPPVPQNARFVALRVIGIGGDAIAIDGGVVYRNGIALREPYVTGPTAYDLSIKDYDIYVDGTPLDRSLANVPPRTMWQSPNRIPLGFYFMLGDNRNYSIDSHYWGFAQTSGTFAAGLLRAQPVAAFGEPLFVAWPLERAGFVEAS
jgi:copper transport protein